MPRNTLLHLIALGALLCAHSAHADTHEELKQTRAQLDAAAEHEKTLSIEHQQLQKELTTIKKLLVSLAHDINKTQDDLKDTQEKMVILNEQITTRKTALTNQKDRLSAVVAAALSLSHTPTEAMIMMPGDVTQAMKTARALKMSSDSVKHITNEIANEIVELNKLHETAQANNTLLTQQRITLENKRIEIQATKKTRQKIFSELDKDVQKAQKKRKSLAQKIHDLEDLVTSMEEERKNFSTSTSTQKHYYRSSRLFADNKGKIAMPVRGKTVTKYGKKKGKNTTTRGTTIETAAGALVTAPFAGEVIFTGPFLKYGDIIILHHEEGFHTLLAGLKEIDVYSGQFLLEGEPIGSMGLKSKENRLYIELRKNNQPINPADWIDGLSK